MSAFALRNANRSVTAEINVTPLVDVMLVVLVIFMLAVPLTTQRFPFFTAADCGARCPAPTEPVRLSVKRTGELYWNGGAINRAQLAANLGALARAGQSQSLEIYPDPGTRYERVTDVLVAARNANVQHISFAPAR
jgi:biopolymer transport protein ExbD